MSGQGTTWWLGEDRKWREGPPPAGWYQGTDGRWHPEEPDPAAVAAAQDPTEPIRIQPPPRRRAEPQPRGFYALPQWTRVALGATVATVALVGAAVFTLRSDHPDDEPANLDRDGGGAGATDPSGDPSTASPDPDSPPGSASSDDPSTSPSSSDPTTSSSTSTTEPTSTSAPPSGPLALCSPGQRAMIERGTHPPEWYVERFDADHDGIFCE